MIKREFCLCFPFTGSTARETVISGFPGIYGAVCQLQQTGQEK